MRLCASDGSQEEGASFAWAGACVKHTRIALDRVRLPEETLALARRVMALVGVTRVANLTGLDRVGIPVVAVTRPNSRSVAVALGKGFTLTAAKASGLMEAIESFHAEHVEQPLRLSSYERLRHGERVIELEGLPRVSAGAFRAGQKLLWIEGRELMREQDCWLPYEVVHADYTLPFPTGSGAFLMSSNGLASGNHLLEAVSHGICEVVERDATSLWQFSTSTQQAATRVDLRSVDDAPCGELIERFVQAGIEVAVWDTTTDVGIPCFRCEVAEQDGSGPEPLHPVSGYGCHPRREVALMRALTEAAQGRLTIIAGARDDLSQSLFDPDEARLMARQLAARDIGVAATRHFHESPTWNAPSVEEDVQWQLSRLESAGIRQVSVVDLTKPEIGIPVVRVVIPGLESLCEAPGYVPGVRLRRRMEQAP